MPRASPTAAPCLGSLRGYQVNEAMCATHKVPISCATSPPVVPLGPAPPVTSSCYRNIYLDMGANWCNTLRLYASVPEAQRGMGWAHDDKPWHVFAIEAAPLIAPYVESCVSALSLGKPLPTPLVPPAGSSMQLLNYAKELGCAKAGGRRERISCISKALEPSLAALGRTANPSLTSNPQLLKARLEGARSRGGCTGASRVRFQFGADAHRISGWRTSDGGSYQMIPAAAGAASGTLRMAGSPLQMLRGGSMMAGSNHMPQFDVARVDVVDWLVSSFTVDDFVVLKMDVEGAEIDIVPKLLATNATRLVDVFLWECHAKWRGTKGKCQCAMWEESLRRAGVKRVYREKYPFADQEKHRAAVWNATAAAALARSVR